MNTKWMIGDLAEVIGIQNDLNAICQIGTVVATSGRIITLQFPTRFNSRLHDGGPVEDETRRCWCFFLANIKPYLPLDSDFSNLL